jgi:hypothetical protein
VALNAGPTLESENKPVKTGLETYRAVTTIQSMSSLPAKAGNPVASQGEFPPRHCVMEAPPVTGFPPSRK